MGYRSAVLILLAALCSCARIVHADCAWSNDVCMSALALNPPRVCVQCLTAFTTCVGLTSWNTSPSKCPAFAASSGCKATKDPLGNEICVPDAFQGSWGSFAILTDDIDTNCPNGMDWTQGDVYCNALQRKLLQTIGCTDDLCDTLFEDSLICRQFSEDLCS